MEPNQRIDSHQHFWQYHAQRHAWITDDMQVLRRHYMPADAWPIMQEAGVFACVAVQADQSDEETAFLLQLADEHNFIKGVVGWIDLTAANIDEQLAHYSGMPLLKGFRHIVQSEPDDNFLLRSDIKRGIQALAAHNYAYDILIFPKQLPAAIQFAKLHDDMRLVIDHGAKPDIKRGVTDEWKLQMHAFADMEHVYCKISGLITEADWQHWQPEQIIKVIDELLEIFGPHRLMFGSDFPVCQLAATYKTVVDLVANHVQKLSATEQQAIMCGTAQSFYQLNF